MKVNLNKIADVNRLSQAAMKIPCDVELKSGRWTVDAKSLMGIFSLDLSSPINVVIDTDDDAVINEFKSKISDIIIED